MNVFDKNNDTMCYDGNILKNRDAPENLITKLKEAEIDLESFISKMSLPSWLTFLEYICFFIALFLFLGLLNSEKDFADIVNTVPAFLFVFTFLIALLLFAVKRYKNNLLQLDPKYKELHELIDNLHQEIEDSLDIPDYYFDVDVLYNEYYLKNDNIKENIFSSWANYEIGSFKMFFDKYNLNCSLGDSILTIPFDSIIDINLIDNKISFLGWEKDEDISSKYYAKYKIKNSEISNIYFIDQFYSISISFSGYSFKILLPNYEESFVYYLEKYLKNEVIQC